MRFIHCADIHLDSPLLNLERYEGAPVEACRAATRRAFEHLVELALARSVDFVLVAGDLYDGECKDMHTPIALRRSLRELTDRGIRVFIVQGNHDAQSRVTKAFSLDLPEGVHLFAAKQPETVVVEELGVAIHGQGYGSPAVAERLAAGFPEPVAHHLNIGLLHTNCEQSAGHGDYAPSTVAELVAKGYDYWALGHIHQRQILRERHPCIAYPGNLQGRKILETGEKGCLLVSADEGEITEVEFCPLDVMRWERVRVDLTAAADLGGVVALVLDAVAEQVVAAAGRALAVRVELAGKTAAHAQLLRHAQHFRGELRRSVVDRFDDRVWLEKVRVETQPLAEVRDAGAAAEATLALIGALDAPDAVREALAELGREQDVLRASLPSDPRLEHPLPDLADPAAAAALVESAKELVLARLLERSEG